MDAEEQARRCRNCRQVLRWSDDYPEWIHDITDDNECWTSVPGQVANPAQPSRRDMDDSWY